MSKRKLTLILFCILVLNPVYHLAAQYRVGDIVDNFSVNVLSGRKINLYDYQGKVVFLYLFRAS